LFSFFLCVLVSLWQIRFFQMNSEKVNTTEKLKQIDSYWDPHIAGELNGQYVKLVKFKGEFTWHHHDNEDEMFFVLKGKFNMEYKDRIVEINEGEFVIVPRGVEHKPVAPEEVHVMLFEPATTLNTGNVINDFTKENLKSI
jgi:mannose-6-phosphate isomerase-like protein (cupin superfamily)